MNSGVFEGVVVVAFQNVFFARRCIKIIFFFIFKKLFLTSANKNDLKTPKNINLK